MWKYYLNIHRIIVKVNITLRNHHLTSDPDLSKHLKSVFIVICIQKCKIL